MPHWSNDPAEVARRSKELGWSAEETAAIQQKAAEGARLERKAEGMDAFNTALTPCLETVDGKERINPFKLSPELKRLYAEGTLQIAFGEESARQLIADNDKAITAITAIEQTEQNRLAILQQRAKVKRWALIGGLVVVALILFFAFSAHGQVIHFALVRPGRPW
jgi:hypothetical protein